MRNFVCPVTETLCEHGGCTKGSVCIIEKQNEARLREGDAHRQLAARADEADITRMMLAIAKRDILEAHRAKYGRAFDKGEEELTNKASLLLRRPEYAQNARD